MMIAADPSVASGDGHRDDGDNDASGSERLPLLDLEG